MALGGADAPVHDHADGVRNACRRNVQPLELPRSILEHIREGCQPRPACPSPFLDPTLERKHMPSRIKSFPQPDDDPSCLLACSGANSAWLRK